MKRNELEKDFDQAWAVGEAYPPLGLLLEALWEAGRSFYSATGSFKYPDFLGGGGDAEAVDQLVSSHVAIVWRARQHLTQEQAVVFDRLALDGWDSGLDALLTAAVSLGPDEDAGEEA